MSTTFHAAAVIGCKVAREKIFPKEDIRRCKHVVNETTKHCPECGLKMWKTVEVPIPEYDSCTNTVRGMKLFDNYYDDDIIVAYHYSKVSQDGNFETEMIPTNMFDDLTEIRAKETFEALGLWDFHRFGIWPVLYCS